MAVLGGVKLLRCCADVWGTSAMDCTVGVGGRSLLLGLGNGDLHSLGGAMEIAALEYWKVYL